MAARVEVVLHKREWRQQFEEEAARLQSAIGPNLCDVHHIGSTSIPGIYAKPIIDTLLEVSDLAGLDDRTVHIKQLGYEAMGEFGIEGRRYFRKNDALSVRTHHVHAFEVGSAAAKRHLAFRDFMIAHPDYAQQYSDLKIQLIEAHAGCAEPYIAGKDPFIKKMDQKAARWLESKRYEQ